MPLPYRKIEKNNRPSFDPLITQAKYDEMTRKLAKIKAELPGAASEVSRLAQLGDFSENAEYQLAKGKLRGMNKAIAILESQLIQAEIIKTSAKSDRVLVGSTVTIINNLGKQKTYQILGSSETKPEQGIISYTSPIGSALLNKKLGEKVKIKITSGELEYEIVNIE